MRSGAALLSLIAFSLALAGAGAARSVDLVAPSVSVSCSPGGSCAGWFTGNVNVSFSWSVPSGEAFWSESGCNGFSVTNDTTGQSYSCQVTVTSDLSRALVEVRQSERWASTMTVASSGYPAVSVAVEPASALVILAPRRRIRVG